MNIFSDRALSLNPKATFHTHVHTHNRTMVLMQDLGRCFGYR